MLSGGRFAKSLTNTGDKTPEINFPDDNDNSMEIAANIVHSQEYAVPKCVDVYRIHSIALLCDKYDMRRRLGRWTYIWTIPYIRYIKKTGYEQWLFVA